MLFENVPLSQDGDQIRLYTDAYLCLAKQKGLSPKMALKTMLDSIDMISDIEHEPNWHDAAAIIFLAISQRVRRGEFFDA